MATQRANTEAHKLYWSFQCQSMLPEKWYKELQIVIVHYKQLKKDWDMLIVYG
jgi:hypothetical protein